MTLAGVVTAFPIPTSDASFAITSGGGALFFSGNQSCCIGSSVPAANKSKSAISTTWTNLGRITTAGGLTSYETSNTEFGRGAAFGPDGNLWFTYVFRNAIGRLDPTDGSITDFQLPGQCCGALDITLGPDGALWYTRSLSIGRITTAGQITEFPYSSTSQYGPDSITTGPDGALWFNDRTAIGRITTTGLITTFPVTSNITDLVAGPDGAIWYTLNGNAPGLGRLTTSGVSTGYPVSGPAVADSQITVGPDGALWLTRDTVVIRAQVSSLSSSLTSMSFLYRVGGLLPASQTTSVSSSGSAIAVTPVVTPAAAWLSAAPVSGNTPLSVTASVNPLGLAPGTYSSSLSLTGNAANTPLSVPVSLNVLPPLAPAPAALTFNYRPGAMVPAAQPIALSSGGVPVPVSAAAIVTTPANGSWLSVAPASATTPSSWTVSVSPTGLPLGTYSGLVRLAAQDAVGGAVDVSVTLNVLPSITAQPASLSFTYRSGAPIPASQTFVVSNAGPAVNVSASPSVVTPANGNWLSVIPTGGATPATFTVQVYPYLLPLGTYTGFVNVLDQTGGTLPIPVTLNVVSQLAATATPAALTFVSVARSVPPEQSVVISRPGAGSLTLRTDVPATMAGLEIFQPPSDETSATWTTMTFVPSGASDVTAQLRINPAQIARLPFGSYSATLSIITGDQTPVTTDVPVTLEMRQTGVQVTGQCPVPTVGERLSFPLTVTGGVGTYSIALSGPAGFTVSPPTGAAGNVPFQPIISGVAETTGLLTVQVTVTDSINSPSAVFQCNMYAISRYVPPVVLTSTTCPASDVPLGTPVLRSLTASGGSGVYTFNSTDLPPGLRINGNSISGVPSEAGTFRYTLTASSAGAQGAEVQCTFRVLPTALKITSACPADANEGQRYFFPIYPTGGMGGASYNLTINGLPPGLVATPGGIQGTAAKQGSYSLEIQVRSGDQLVTQSCPMKVNDAAGRPPGPAGTITCPTDPVASGGSVSILISGSGGTGTYTFTASAPAWLQLTQNGSSATLSGTAGPPGRYPVSVTISDASGSTQVSCTVVVTEAPLVLTGPVCPASVSVGSPIDLPVSATGGTQPYQWSISAGPGLALSSSVGSSTRITGAPTEIGPLGVSTSVTDASGNRRQSSCTIQVTPQPLSISGQGCPTAPVNRPSTVSVSLAATGGRGEYSWQLSGPALLSLSSSSGQTVSVSGAPTAPGNFSFTATLTDQSNSSPATFTCAFSVPAVPAPTLSVNGLTLAVNTSQTNDLELVLLAPSPVPLTATVVLSFAADVTLAGVTDNPLVQFTNGFGRIITVTIPAGQTRVPLGAKVNLSNVAGTARVTVSSLTDAGQQILVGTPPPTELRLARAAPVLDSVTSGSGGVVVRGFSNTLDMQSVTLTFTAAPDVTIEGPSTFNFTTEIQQFFEDLYRNRPASGGSAFEVRFPLTLGGDPGGIASVTVTFRNSAGEVTGQANFR